ncbi:MAG: hypothetical protein JW910_17845 [Anaerolineae bacterium]|nr:hypothetical protein [Anaerolineae bacterium]
MQQQGVTFGQELRRFRARRGISQFDLAVCMDWKGTSPVIQLEKDRRVPQPDTIARLGKCLSLNYLELHYLTGLAGYIPPTRLPPRDYVIETLDHIAAIIADFPYPVYVVDYQMRFWLANRATAILSLGDLDLWRGLMARPLNAFDIVFDSRLGFRPHIPDLPQFDREQVFRFKATNSFRQHEPFFLALPERMRTLEPDDYRAFEAAWNAIDMTTLTRIQPVQVADFYARMEQGDIRLAFPEGPVSFHLRVDSILHLGDLFSVITYVPVASAALPDNKARAEAISAAYRPDVGDPVRVWDVTDITPFFEG